MSGEEISSLADPASETVEACPPNDVAPESPEGSVDAGADPEDVALGVCVPEVPEEEPCALGDDSGCVVGAEVGTGTCVSGMGSVDTGGAVCALVGAPAGAALCPWEATHCKIIATTHTTPIA